MCRYLSQSKTRWSSSLYAHPRAAHVPPSAQQLTQALQITQRVLQLTAHRISDSAVSRAKTLHDLCAAYRKTEAPKKLAQEPKVQKMKVELANVTWHDSKRTMIQKEKDVGRWKIIEEALADANLPSTGSRWKQARTHIR